jgi:signal transduction histidine kinase
MSDSSSHDEIEFKAFLSTLIHDLHQPFAIINGYTELLRNELSADTLNRAQLSEYAERIDSGVQKLGKALEEVREFLKNTST